MTENERFAWDSYRRLVQMFGNVSRGVPGEQFEEAIRAVKQERGVKLDTELDTAALQRADRRASSELYDFPQDPAEQLRQAIRAVFDSWTGERAVAYRRINAIPDEWGTAVNVQQMVFGNKGDSVGDRRGVQPRRGDRRARAVGRLPGRRAGRGRRVRRAQHARRSPSWPT